MSNFKGTKEEWLVSNCLVFANDCFQTHIALIPDSYNTEIKQANAKLIACAPEMLENAQMHIDCLDLSDFEFYEKYVFNVSELIPRTRNLIKKATEL